MILLFFYLFFSTNLYIFFFLHEGKIVLFHWLFINLWNTYKRLPALNKDRCKIFLSFTNCSLVWSSELIWRNFFCFLYLMDNKNCWNTVRGVSIFWNASCFTVRLQKKKKKTFCDTVVISGQWDCFYCCLRSKTCNKSKKFEFGYLFHRCLSLGIV